VAHPCRNEEVSRDLIYCVKDSKVVDALLVEKLDEPPTRTAKFVL